MARGRPKGNKNNVKAGLLNVSGKNQKVSRTVRKTEKPNGNTYIVIATRYFDGTCCTQSKTIFRKAA